ncbi:PREDICTED: uncharacterized protein LOC105362383 [Ceratosolen solmsi marchali]|uniref:Uncharacterized protein LOC105362383 n=1 Tax=Ceratosolen solmsi marchali TaxID=326594 RepID=A0AAJ6YHE1_9HYME|nr:PREDICTED: uncharacterized protein LOC105362383 [Ceratosolen solmsi marchali]
MLNKEYHKTSQIVMQILGLWPYQNKAKKMFIQWILTPYVSKYIEYFMFRCISFIGQQIIDTSEQIFNSSYFCEWFILTNKEKIFLKLIMIRSIHPCTVKIIKVSPLSFKTFGKY